jgi:hypothetical protein
VFPDVWIVQQLLGRAEQRDLRVEGEPAVLIAQVILHLRQAEPGQHLADRLRPGFPAPRARESAAM